MAMKSIYEVLREKEIQLQEVQRLLNEAQAALNRVLEMDAAMAGSERVSLQPVSAGSGARVGRQSGSSWEGNGSAEFP